MKHNTETRTTNRTLCRLDGATGHRGQGRQFPHLRPSLAPLIHNPLARRILWHIYAAALVITNIWLAHVAGELLDLYISSVELWAELAEKHLEITLSSSGMAPGPIAWVAPAKVPSGAAT